MGLAAAEPSVQEIEKEVLHGDAAEGVEVDAGLCQTMR